MVFKHRFVHSANNSAKNIANNIAPLRPQTILQYTDEIKEDVAERETHKEETTISHPGTEYIHVRLVHDSYPHGAEQGHRYVVEVDAVCLCAAALRC